jgi:hypothetical protein
MPQLLLGFLLRMITYYVLLIANEAFICRDWLINSTFCPQKVLGGRLDPGSRGPHWAGLLTLWAASACNSHTLVGCPIADLHLHPNGHHITNA